MEECPLPRTGHLDKKAALPAQRKYKRLIYIFFKDTRRRSHI